MHASSFLFAGCSALLGFLVLQGPAVSPPPRSSAVDLSAALIAAVDASDPMARRNAANAIGSRKDATIDALTPLLQRFGPAAADVAVEPGMHVERVPLTIEGKVEDVELVYYVPASLDRTKPAPLIVVSHFTGGEGGDVAPMWKPCAEALGMFVLAPSENGPNKGYSFADHERSATLAALRWMRRRFDVDESRVYATGVSRGGHLTWDLALRRPDLFAAIAPMIGSPRFNLTHGQNNLRFLENVVALPIRDLQGSKDDPAMLRTLHDAFAKLETWKAPDVRLIEFPERGHDYDFDAVDWTTWLGGIRRPDVPARVVRTACEKTEARAFWVEITNTTKDVVEDLRPSVPAGTWNSMDENARYTWLEKDVEKHTARLEVTMDAPGSFTARGSGVASFRLLLAQSMFDPAKPVVVTFDGKRIEKRVALDAKVMLREFVERFDRTFLPVATIDVP